MSTLGGLLPVPALLSHALHLLFRSPALGFLCRLPLPLCFLLLLLCQSHVLQASQGQAAGVCNRPRASATQAVAGSRGRVARAQRVMKFHERGQAGGAAASPGW